MITSWAYMADGSFRAQVPRDLVQCIIEGPNNLLWMDFEDPTDAEVAILREDFKFHPLLIDDCIASHSQPKVDEFDGYFFMVIHSCFYYTEKDAEEALNIRELDIFVGRNFVITFHKGHIKSVSTNRKRCEQGCHIMMQGSDYLFYNIIDSLVDNYFPILDVLSERLEHLEEEILSDPRPEILARIFSLKRSLISLRKTVGPQRELIGRFARPGFPFIREQFRPYYRDVYDHILRIYDISESARELISADMEAYLSSISFKLNETMKTLTVISTFILPLTLITGFYGMNIEIPEFKLGLWGYLIVWSLILMTSSGVIMYFKKKRLL